MSAERTFADMGFRGFLEMARTALDDAELAYNAIVDGADARDDMIAAFQDAGHAVAMASSKGLSDALTLSRAARGEFDTAQLDDADLYAAIAADVDAGLSDMDTDPQADPDRDARFLRDVEAAQGEPHYRDTHPFPVDPETGEEQPW